MDSATKNHQSPAVLRELAVRAYGAHQVPDGHEWVEELTFSYFSAVYRMQLRDGTEAVLKIAPSPDVEIMTYERDSIALEAEALRLIAERTTVPVPRVHHVDRTRQVCDSDCLFMEFLPGDTFAEVRDRLEPHRRVACAEAMGDANRRLNAVTGPGFGSLLAPSPHGWRTVFTSLVEDVLADGLRRDVDLGVPYDAVREALERDGSHLDEVESPHLMTWDLWDGNVLVRDGRITGIIDHERALWADPLMEHGFVATVLPAAGDPAPFLRGYGRGPLQAGELVRRRRYTLHFLLILIIETAYRRYPDTNQYDWAREQLTGLMALQRTRTA